MLAQARKSVRNTLPVSKWVVAIAAIYGISIGSTRLDESLDLATAMGISGFFSVAVGSWLAIHLYHVLIRGYVAWIAIIERRANATLALLPVSPKFEESEVGNIPRASLAARTVAFSFYLTMHTCGAFTSCLLYTALTLQIDDRTSIVHFVTMGVISLILLALVAGQCLYFMRLHWKIASIERQMERVAMIPQVTGRTAVLGTSITRTARLGRRFVNPGPSSAEQTVVSSAIG